MHPTSSLEEPYLSFLSSVTGMDPERGASPLNFPMQTGPSKSLSSYTSTAKDQNALITTPPELRLRNAIPEPQATGDCSQADQSASQAIQKANQQASQSIQQASQQAAQSIQQASQQASQASEQAAQSASLAIQQISIQASNSLAAASRSVNSVISSASSVIASVQSSASQAISQANGSMFSAQASASSAQSDASKAVVQLQAAVAAATGSAAAAGSSFLAAAAKATQGAQASVSAIGAQASSQVSQASQQASVSQTVAITATEAALAIVGSIIASTLITMSIYFLVLRHKKIAKKRSRDKKSFDYTNNPKISSSGTVGSTLVDSRQNFNRIRDDPMNGSQVTFSLSAPQSNSAQGDTQGSDVRTTTVKWDPKNPPQAPRLGSWLKIQSPVTPFGSIKLPEVRTPSPLGGQLKSPLQSATIPRKPIAQQIGPNSVGPKPIPRIAPSIRPAKASTSVGNITTITVIPRSPANSTATIPSKSDSVRSQIPISKNYGESRASVWTDEVPEQSPSPPLRSPSLTVQDEAGGTPVSLTNPSRIKLPELTKPIRNTAEWLASNLYKEQQALAIARTALKTSGQDLGLSNRPDAARNPAERGSLAYIESQGQDRTSTDNGQRSSSRIGGGQSRMRSTIWTPGVGKAI